MRKKDAQNIQDLAEVFRALSDPTRLRIVKLLTDAGGALCVNALAARLDVTQSAVSQHLRILRQTGLVTAHRHGRWVHYSLNTERLRDHRSLLRSTLGDGIG